MSGGTLQPCETCTFFMTEDAKVRTETAVNWKDHNNDTRSGQDTAIKQC